MHGAWVAGYPKWKDTPKVEPNLVSAGCDYSHRQRWPHHEETIQLELKFVCWPCFSGSSMLLLSSCHGCLVLCHLRASHLVLPFMWAGTNIFVLHAHGWANIYWPCHYNTNEMPNLVGMHITSAHTWLWSCRWVYVHLYVTHHVVVQVTIYTCQTLPRAEKWRLTAALPNPNSSAPFAFCWAATNALPEPVLSEMLAAPFVIMFATIMAA